MTIRSTEKVERKAVDGNFDESAVDFLLDGSDASNLDLGKDEGDASEDIRRAQRPAVVNPMEKAAAVPQKMQLPTTAAIIATASSTVPLTKMMGWTASRPRRHHLPLAGLARRRPVGAAAKRRTEQLPGVLVPLRIRRPRERPPLLLLVVKVTATTRRRRPILCCPSGVCPPPTPRSATMLRQKLCGSSSPRPAVPSCRCGRMPNSSIESWSWSTLQ